MAIAVQHTFKNLYSFEVLIYFGVCKTGCYVYIHTCLELDDQSAKRKGWGIVSVERESVERLLESLDQGTIGALAFLCVSFCLASFWS